MSDKEIARELGISDDTVAKHIGAAMRKLGVTNRKAALRALGGEIGPYPSSPVSRAAVSSDLSAAVADHLSDPRTSGAPASSPYGWYQRLGLWRTPPRSTAFRVRVILGWVVIGSVVLLILLAISLMLFGGTEAFAPALRSS